MNTKEMLKKAKTINQAYLKYNNCAARIRNDATGDYPIDYSLYDDLADARDELEQLLADDIPTQDGNTHPFIVTIGDGYCDYRYEFQISEEASIQDIACAIAEKFTDELSPRGIRVE